MAAPRPDIVLIAGPTASGKTALAIHAAEALDGEIVNADSMQVYDGLNLITARPSVDELAAAPHHLFGVIDPGIRCSVGHWLSLAQDKITDITARGKVAIVVGGTGLYFKSLTQGLAPAPDIPDAIKAKSHALYEAQGIEGLRAEAEKYDRDAAARILGNDPQRLLRVIEIGWVTGQSLTQIQNNTAPVIARERWRGIVIEPDRAALYARIDARFRLMMTGGALEEVEAILARNLDPQLPAMKAVGVPQLRAYLAGDMTLEAAIADAQMESRRYAKRQYTWFRNQHGDWDRITSLDPGEARAQCEALIGDLRP
ncbi:tRNA (adenosine(37)-N6)-dimethylallyltransferase MiaA [Woodsholea maritima]|uniref:tRNA (adenosine(37)-N6)-dimethylallyltransferase MiaA n=1 Tax=Woodsholea maritima TaxID=240237 RepID=UPI00035DAC72|nr:tRNA (adenosine(37)-N6)-dimethylallyltransferase MiaA [Woodsholea maritima]